MYEEEVDVIVDVPVEEEIVIDMPTGETTGYLYVCSECGGELTEIPTYNRFYCEYCGLHY